MITEESGSNTQRFDRFPNVTFWTARKIADGLFQYIQYDKIEIQHCWTHQ